MPRLREPPSGQCLAAWDDDVIIVSPPADWEDRGVSATYRSLPMGSYGYRHSQVVLSALTTRSPFLRLRAPARRDIAEEEMFFPQISHHTYLALLDAAWDIRSRLLREPAVEPARGWRRRVRRRRQKNTEQPASPYRVAAVARASVSPPRPGPTFSLGPLGPVSRPFLDYVVCDATSACIAGDRLIVESGHMRKSVPLATFSCEIRFIDTEQGPGCTDLHFGSRCVLRLGSHGIPGTLDRALPRRARPVVAGPWPWERVEICDALY